MRHLARALYNKFMNNGAKAVADAVTGLDFRTFLAGGKAYMLYPPTIERLCGAISHLSRVKDAETVKDVLLSLGDMDEYSKALSWFVAGDETLSGEFAKCSLEEVVNALDMAIGMISVEVFLKAVSLARSVSLLAARPK